jgi:hypothetical protein
VALATQVLAVLMNEGGLATLDLAGLAVGCDEGPFGVLLIDRDGADAWPVCSRDGDVREVNGDWCAISCCECGSPMIGRLVRQGRGHGGRSAFLITGLALAVASLVASTPATARPIDKGHFHDVFTSDVYDCDGTPAQDSGDVSGNFVFNQRGSSPFPYYRESVHGTVVTTNLNTGGTFTAVFSVSSRDHTIVDNGDGTITITVFASGGSRFYDTNGKLVLKDPGQFRFAFDVDYNGTPGDPSDDVEIPDSFRVVRGSTGNSDLSDRDFCADLVEFTS